MPKVLRWAPINIKFVHTSHKQVHLNIKCKYWYVATFLPTVPETKCLLQTSTFDNFSLVMSSLDIAFNQANCCSVVSDSTSVFPPISHNLWKPKNWKLSPIRPVVASYHYTKYHYSSQSMIYTSSMRNLHHHFNVPVQQYGRRISLSWKRNSSIR